MMCTSLKKAGFNIAETCQLLHWSRNRYYRHQRPKPIDANEVKLRAAIRHLHQESHGTYGSRRLRIELANQGFAVGRYKVRSLMQSLSLKTKRPRQHRYPKATGSLSVIAPNVLNRQFNPDKHNTHWSGDITYVRTQQGWLYLAIVIDLYSRRIVGWSSASQPNSELSVKALHRAIWQRRLTEKAQTKLLFHTDQGTQYSSETFQRTLRSYNIQASMSRRGNCLDNAVTERFFRSLKTEWLNHKRYLTREEATADIAHYIERFYNPVRRHSALGYLSPVEYEKKYCEI